MRLGYASVSTPTEGTILTVAREATTSLNTPEAHDASLQWMLRRLTSAAHTSLENTPNLLPALKDAGVVDAGGMGLVSFLKGMGQGKAGPRRDRTETADEVPAAVDSAESYGYDVQFLMVGECLHVGKVRAETWRRLAGR